MPMTTRLIATTIAVALALAPATPPAFADAPPPRGLVDDAVLLDAWASSGLTATAAGEHPVQITASRGELDTSLVVTIVRERLREVALRAAGDLLRELVGDSDRLWARDLLALAARLTGDEPELRRATAEAVVRLTVRAVIADAIVRTRHPAGDAAWRTHLADWLYWRLARHPLVADSVARPTCARRTGGAGELCAQLVALDDTAAVAEIDRRTGLQDALHGLVLVARIQQSLKDAPMPPRAIIKAFLDADGLARFGDGSLIDPARWKALVADLRTRVADVASLSAYAQSLRKRAQAVGQKIESLSSAADPGRIAAELVTDLDSLQKALNTPFGTTTVRAAFAAAGGETLRIWLDGADGAITRARTKLAASPVLAEAELVDVRKAIATLSALQPPELFNLTVELEDQVTELTELVASKMTGAELATLATGDGARLARLLNRFAGTLDKLQTQLGAYDAKLRGRLAEMAATVRRVAALVDKVTGFAGMIGGARLGEVMHALQALGVREHGEVVTPLLDVLDPVLDQLADGKPVTMPVLYRALAELGPGRVAAALGLPEDLEALCADGKPPWQCWAGRLALGVHDAVRADGTSVEIDTSRVLERLASAGAAERKRRFGRPFLHATVGAGGLYLGDGVPPLVAEQLGVGVNLYVKGPLGVRAALFGSGLLYRFVVDSKASDGVMFGGALLVDLYDTVELYGAPVMAFHTGETDDDGAIDLGVAFGIQVPLGDYLARLRAP